MVFFAANLATSNPFASDEPFNDLVCSFHCVPTTRNETSPAMCTHLRACNVLFRHDLHCVIKHFVFEPDAGSTDLQFAYEATRRRRKLRSFRNRRRSRSDVPPQMPNCSLLLSA